ncbi:MAG: hypothetical protein IT368_06675, partial [Candidatus Hydrogenedentes bacterium]|nr:hypothetical protein [Candidatus Hydrogenedentota bacterium]
LCTFEEDADPRTGTAPGAVISGEGLSIWREQKAPLRFNGRESASVFLGWKEPATYTVSAALPALDSGRVLSFTLADANELPEGAEAPEGESIELGIEAEDASGRRARLPLSRYGTLYRQFANSPFKPWVSNDMPPGQAVPQSFRIPLADFGSVLAAPELGPLQAVRFVFDGTAAGTVILDDLGILEE